MDTELRAEIRAWKIEVEDRLKRLEDAIKEMNKPIVPSVSTAKKDEK